MNEKTFNSKPVHVEILWINISHLNKTLQFTLCCSSIFTFYLLYGFLQEYMFGMSDFKDHGWFITLVQFIYFAIFSYIEILCRRTKRLAPIKIHFILAILTVGTVGFSNSSLKYLNYPTEVIFKCCKMIPVMIGGTIIQKKKYEFLDYLASLIMCIGLTVFCLADSQVSPAFNFSGIIMISLALICDSLIGNLQEKVMKEYAAPNHEIMLYSYSFGLFCMFIALTISGEVFSGAAYCIKTPIIFGHIFLFSVCGYLGIQAVLSLVRTCGALTTVTVTTFRKALSIILSFIFFSKPFTWLYFYGGMLIVVSIYINLLQKKQVNLVKTFENLLQRRRRKSLLDIV